MQPWEATIPVHEICKKVLVGEVLDLFHIIEVNQEISKKEIGDRFLEAIMGPGVDVKKSQKRRLRVTEYIAKLEGAQLIDYFVQGTAHIYSLTPNGQIAVKIIADLIEQDPSFLKGSIIVKKYMNAE